MIYSVKVSASCRNVRASDKCYLFLDEFPSVKFIYDFLKNSAGVCRKIINSACNCNHA